MPKFEKDCHAYVLNLKRKARVNVKNTTTEVNNVQLNKVPVQTQNVPQPNISYYEPITLVPNYQAKNVNVQNNPTEHINHYEQMNPHIYGDTSSNMNGNFGMVLPQLQNQSNLGNMNFINNFLNMNPMNQINHTNDVHAYNALNNYNNVNTCNNLNNGNNMHKLGSMHSVSTFNSNSTLDTTSIHMSDLGNLSNRSNISSLSNVTNPGSTNHIIPFSRQPSNAMYNYMTHPQSMQDQMYLNCLNNWQYYFSMMSYSAAQYNQFEPDAAIASFLNNNNHKIPELNPTNMFIPPIEIKEDEPKPIKTTKAKAQSKRSKQTNGLHNKAKPETLEILDDFPVLDTFNDISFDFFDFSKPEESLNCKRKGNAEIQSFEEIVKKSKLNNPLGVE